MNSGHTAEQRERRQQGQQQEKQAGGAGGWKSIGNMRAEAWVGDGRAAGGGGVGGGQGRTRREEHRLAPHPPQ